MEKQLNNARILLVDDTPANIQVLGPVLKKLGYQLHVAQSGIQALEICKRVRPDLILLDIMMPEIDGYETCRRLKANPDTALIPVIFLSARNQTEDVIKGFEIGAVDYITKPFNPAELTVRVQNHLELKFARENLEEAHEKLKIEYAKEKQLLIKSQTLSEAVRNAAASILITNHLGEISYANPKFLQITGYELKDVLGKTPSLFHSGETPADTYKDLWETISRGKEWHGKILNRRKDGTNYWEYISISSIKDENNQITHYIATAEDLTDQLRLEALAKEKSEKEARDRLINQFLSTVSHELRTPMNGIIGMTDLMQETDLNTEQYEYMEIIHKASNDLLELINDMLNFVEIQSGKMHLQEQSFTLVDLVKQITETFARESKLKGLDFNLKIDGKLPNLLYGDSAKVKDILSKLLSNAVKFTHRGVISLEVVHNFFRNDYHSIQFVISDTGIGIPKDIQQKIFRAFTQGDGSITRQYEGIGIGLAIASTLIRHLKGQFWIDSTVDEGTSFYFTLKFKESHE